MIYKILIPCLLIVILSIVGIYSFANNKQIETDEEIDIIHEEIELPEKQDELPENHIILDMNKEQCKSGITKCDASGCKEQC